MDGEKYVNIMFDFGQANEEQKRVISHTDGPTLVIAGPGTGKTFTIVKRVVYLIAEKGVKPENISICSFYFAIQGFLCAD